MIPVFVPSYRRPKATFLTRALDYEFPMYVFVRKEDFNSYSYLGERSNVKVVVLPKWISNIGETRRAMFKYAVKRGIPKVFMIDDDVTRLDLSVWDSEKGVVRASGTVNQKRENFDRVLNHWEVAWKKYFPYAAMFGASYRPFSWSIKQEQIKNAPRSQLQQCVGIDVEKIHNAGLNYKSNSIVGNEDLFLQLECYRAGLDCIKYSGVQYDCAAMGVGEGGCNASEAGSIKLKQERRVKAFLNACNYSDLIKVSQTKSGVKSVKFIWKQVSKIMDY